MMKIVCMPGISKDEVKEWEKKLNNANESDIIVIPFECMVIQISELDNHSEFAKVLSNATKKMLHA